MTHKITAANLGSFQDAIQLIISVMADHALAPNWAASFGGHANFVFQGNVICMPILKNGRPEVESVTMFESSAWDGDMKGIVARWLNDPKFIRLNIDEMKAYSDKLGIVCDPRLTTGFDLHGMWIHNPMISECGRFEDDPNMPEQYGFEVITTGGGCLAWQRVCENGDYLLLTDTDGCRLPVDWTDAIIGRYDSEGNVVVEADSLSFEPE